jgi:acetyl esterase/lipase
MIAPSRSRSRTRRIVAAALLAVLALLWRPATAHLRAVSFLLRFADPQGHSMLADARRHEVRDEAFALPGSRGRLYFPADVPNAAELPAVVVVHGVHYKGIDEPRLQRFARTLAATGVVALTPELPELCDYRVDPASIDTIGQAVRALAEQRGGKGGPRPVGVLGLSFAGGLSLLAAADPRYAPSFAFVVTVGAHDDLGRVLRFFTTNEAPRPDGTAMHLQAHAYGPAVVVYGHVEDFFPAADVEVARDALRAWLHEDFAAAKAKAAALTPEAMDTRQPVFDRDTAALAPRLEAEVVRLQPTFSAVSPAGHLAGVHVPVYFLHGAGDSVIPATEAEWLAHDAPPSIVRGVLVSRALEHVELESSATIGDELALVHFMSMVLQEADDEPR